MTKNEALFAQCFWKGFLEGFRSGFWLVLRLFFQACCEKLKLWKIAKTHWFLLNFEVQSLYNVAKNRCFFDICLETTFRGFLGSVLELKKGPKTVKKRVQEGFEKEVQF